MISSYLLNGLLSKKAAWEKFVVSTACGLISLGLVLLLENIKPNAGSTLSLDVIAIVLSAAYGGLFPALWCAAIAGFGEDYYVTSPIGQISTDMVSILDKGVNILFAVFSAYAVSKIKELIQRLNRELERSKELEQAQLDMLNIVAHDLRNPLSAMRMSAGLLKAAAPSDSAKRERFIDQIDRTATRMDRLIADLLDAEKISGRTFVVRPALTSVEQLVQDLVASISREAAAKEVEIVVSKFEDGSVIEADQFQILRVLCNIASNAIKFSPKGKRLKIDINPTGEALTFVISDEGPGIPAEDLPHLFDRYWQNKATASQGTGLGLFVSRGIVEAHRGALNVSSTVGAGSSFSVRLPRPASNQ